MRIGFELDWEFFKFFFFVVIVFWYWEFSYLFWVWVDCSDLIFGLFGLVFEFLNVCDKLFEGGDF